MNKPVRNDLARLRTVEQVAADANLCRNTVVRIAKEADAYLHIGRSVRIDNKKFFDYVIREYKE